MKPYACNDSKKVDTMNLDDELAQEQENLSLEEGNDDPPYHESEDEVNELDFESSAALKLSGMNFNADSEIEEEEEEEEDQDYINYSDNIDE